MIGRTGNNSFISTFITQEKLNGTRNLRQQDNQSASHFINEEIVETMPTTTQQSLPPFHPAPKTPRKKNAAFSQTIIQSTVKFSVIPKNSQLDNQTFKPVTTSRQTNKQKTSLRNNFSNLNYNFFQKNQKHKTP